MVVDNGTTAQKFHVHDLPKGSLYKGVHKQIMMADLAKVKITDEHPNGMKWSAYKGLVDRQTNELISSDLNQIAKILLNPKAKGADLGSVESIVKANPEAQAIVDKYEADPESAWMKKKIPAPTETLEDKQLKRIKELLPK